MYRLPLFPLNTVLFPKMPLNLHIFEERYKLMIQRCISQNQPFGVVLIESGSEVQGFGSEAIPFMVGCTAVISQVQNLPLGRYNLVALGEQRFEVIRLEMNEPYLVGVVQDLTLRPALDSDALARSEARVRFWLERYLQVLEKAEQVQFDRSQLPANTVDLAYLAATIVKIPNVDKQQLLAQNDLVTLLDSLRRIYRKEVTILNMMVDGNTQEEVLPFSLN
jgi:Lon protease-like protein